MANKRNLKVNITADASALQKETKKASKAVQDFDPTLKVPFEAFFAQKISWHMADEKRKNAKRDKQEKAESRLKKNDDEADSIIDNGDMNPFTGERNVLESDYEQCEIIDIIRHRLANSPKMLIN